MPSSCFIFFIKDTALNAKRIALRPQLLDIVINARKRSVWVLGCFTGNVAYLMISDHILCKVQVRKPLDEQANELRVIGVYANSFLISCQTKYRRHA